MAFSFKGPCPTWLRFINKPPFAFSLPTMKALLTYYWKRCPLEFRSLLQEWGVSPKSFGISRLVLSMTATIRMDSWPRCFSLQEILNCERRWDVARGLGSKRTIPCTGCPPASANSTD